MIGRIFLIIEKSTFEIYFPVLNRNFVRLIKYMKIKILGLIGLTLLIQCNSKNETMPFNDDFDKTSFYYTSPEIPKELSFAGEIIPLERHDLREMLDLEFHKNAYWHSNTLLMIKRSKKYFPIIEPILKEEQIPDDFKYLAAIESNLDLTITSPAKAKGLWQFMEETGRDQGLEINEFIDERSHIEKSTRAACKYLKILKNSTQSWSLAALSYNAGYQNIKKCIDSQKVDKFYDLKIFDETDRYLFRLLAVKSILQQPEKYQFKVAESDYYYFPKMEEFIVNTPVDNWANWANSKGNSYQTLRYYNPWINSLKLQNSMGKTYKINLPKK